MVGAGVFTHGTDFAGRITAAGYSWSAAGENIATGYPTPAAVVAGWMRSTGHCRNILSPAFRDLGVGVTARPVAAMPAARPPGPRTSPWPAGPSRRRTTSGPANGCPY